MKTKRIVFFPYIISLALFVGCEEESSLQVPLEANCQGQDTTLLNFKAIYSDHHTMSWEDAALFAEKSAECFLSENNPSELRSGKQRRIVNNGFVLKKEKSSSLRNASIQNQLPDTLAYICNFADSMGFAIICADDRVGCPILACVDNGMIEDSVENPGLAIFLENAYDFIEDKILNFEEKKDSLRKIADEFITNHETESSAILKSVYTGTFDGSSTSEKDAMTYLKKIGYKECDSQDYSFSKVRSELVKNRPILMNGKKKKVLFVSYEGHAWVVDGYSTSIVEDYLYRIDMEKNENKYWVTKTVYKNSLLHINWGWAGKNNGYFAEGCFNTANAIQYDSQKGDSHSDYKYNNKIHIAWK